MLSILFFNVNSLLLIARHITVAGYVIARNVSTE